MRTLSYIFEFVGLVVGGSQRLLSLNPTTVLVVLLLGFWLLLGCDKNVPSASPAGTPSATTKSLGAGRSHQILDSCIKVCL